LLALWSLVLLLGVAAFLGSLVVYMPIRFAAQHVDLTFPKEQLSGTIWNGLVALDGDHVLQWQVDEQQGFEAAPAALARLFTGANRGKQILRV